MQMYSHIDTEKCTLHTPTGAHTHKNTLIHIHAHRNTHTQINTNSFNVSFPPHIKMTHIKTIFHFEFISKQMIFSAVQRNEVRSSISVMKLRNREK